MKSLPVLLGLALLTLSGCDAWPTIMNNRSGRSIVFRYHERSHKEWSASFQLRADRAQRLAQEHWVQDITGLRVIDNGKLYMFDYASLEPIRRACSSMSLARRLKITPDCYVTYAGDGRVSGSFVGPAKLIIDDSRTGS
jgi:hypothetical protein